MRRIALIATFLLAACGNPMMVPMAERPVDVMRVEVPIHVPCEAKKNLGPDPVFDDSDEALRDLPFPMPMSDDQAISNWFSLTQKLAAGRKQRIARDAEKTSVLNGC